MSAGRTTRTRTTSRPAWVAGAQAHWKTATFGWLAFVLVAFGLGGMVGTKNIDNAAGPGESGRMDRILDAGFKQPASENVLIHSRSARAGTAAFDAAIADVVARLSKITVVQNIRSPLVAGNADQHLEGRALRARRVSTSAARRTKAVDKIAPVLDARCRRATRPSRASRSASSATQAQRRASRPRTTTTSARRERSRCRSR